MFLNLFTTSFGRCTTVCKKTRIMNFYEMHNTYKYIKCKKGLYEPCLNLIISLNISYTLF